VEKMSFERRKKREGVMDGDSDDAGNDELTCVSSEERGIR